MIRNSNLEIQDLKVINLKSYSDITTPIQTKNKSYSKQEYQYKEESKATNSNKKYARFYSDNPYIVLGVSESDSKSEIKRVKNKLLQQYHPDKVMIAAPEKLEQYHEITIKIMDVFEEIENTNN